MQYSAGVTTEAAFDEEEDAAEALDADEEEATASVAGVEVSVDGAVYAPASTVPALDPIVELAVVPVLVEFSEPQLISAHSDGSDMDDALPG
ncbi:hypothetical protein GN244_ATG09515 [Phytophthora infestans]|uniref:Uncharacterized protein n=1 Tax=Phytophthora infestans TaxID=4787 RepID=A0A833W1F3_PHYIN|nr:hypothetical protein GN244_ATG09515 [Phytophthora infestans]